jgi:hypothetical protein
LLFFAGNPSPGYHVRINEASFLVRVLLLPGLPHFALSFSAIRSYMHVLTEFYIVADDRYITVDSIFVVCPTGESNHKVISLESARSNES